MRISGKEEAPWLRCRGCHKVFGAVRWHCSHCHETFSTKSAVEWHRQQDMCVPPERFGWVKEDYYWTEPVKKGKK